MTRATVFDASVAINVLGCGKAEEVFCAFSGRIVVPDVTSNEVYRDPLHPERPPSDLLAPFVDRGIIERIPLEGAALKRFIALVGAAPPDDLDDGEAGAIALAEALGARIALDETKGRRILREQFPHLQTLTSVAVFASPEVAAAMGIQLPDVVSGALMNSRMRVLVEDDAWVRQLLGERATQCPSLRKRRR